MEIPIAAEIEHYLFEPEDTSLPKFIVLEFSGREGISQLTRFSIKLVNTDPDTDFSKILNKRASLKIWCWQDEDYSRVYHGIVSSFEQVGMYEYGQQEYAVFQAELVPLLWRTTLVYSCRIFQEDKDEMTVPKIIEYILRDVGFQGDDYDISSLQGDYKPLVDPPPREFCVQYRETNFNFISRLMEEKGIFYFFRYGDDKEVLVIADSNSVFEETAPTSEVRYEIPSELQPLHEEYVYPLSYRESVLSNRFLLRDYNYDTPETDLQASSQIDKTANYETYDYPGHFGLLDRGATLAKVRNEESEAGRKIISGGSNCRSFCAGYLVTLTDHPRADLEGEFLLNQVSHHGIQGAGVATDVRTSYENKFECMPSDVPYRPPRVTPKARVQGTHTATVIGPEGEKLYMDDKGRAKVVFHWDLAEPHSEESSCWIRVSHGYAGIDHGIQFHPLVGDEVIVDFLEGDPDKPIIVGRVYNTVNMPPLKPDDRIQNIVLTPYQHRLLFDDKKTQIVLNTGGKETMTMTDGDESKTDHGNNINISTADKHFIHMAQGTEAEGITVSTVKENMMVFDDKNENITIKTTNGHMAVMDDMNMKIEVVSADGHSVTIDDQGQSITVVDSGGSHKFEIDIAGSKITVSTTGSIDMKAGGEISINAGTNLNIEAGMNAVLKAGVNLDLEGGMNVTSKAGLQHETSGALVKSAASAINTISGGLVKIN